MNCGVCACVCVRSCICVCECVCVLYPLGFVLVPIASFCAMDLFTLSMTEQETITSSHSSPLGSALRKETNKIKADLTIKMIHLTHMVPNARM